MGDRAVSADSGGYAQLEVWAQELGRGLTGSGSRAPAAMGLGSPATCDACRHAIGWFCDNHIV